MSAMVAQSMKPILLMVLLVAASLSGCFGGDDSGDSPVEAVFSFTPNENIRASKTIEFDATSSLPQDGSLSYKWDFQDDGSVDETGSEADWSYPETGNYTVKLTVTDGTNSHSQTRSLTIIAADAVVPEADAGSYSPTSDCDGEDPVSGNYYLFYICEMNKELSNKRVDATRNIQLDASASSAGSDEEYISDWNWDTDLLRDSDGDGDFENDADLSGQTPEWKDVSPGEYKIVLTVINGQGFTDTDDVVVNVNYVGVWPDFEIGGTNSNTPVDMEFTFSVSQHSDSGNTIRRAVGELVYPNTDADCIVGEESCRPKLDLFGFNETDEEAGNTSETPLDQRQAGDCDSSNDCVWLQFTGSYHFENSQWKDGDWTTTLRNEKWNDLEIESFTIRLIYK